MLVTELRSNSVPTSTLKTRRSYRRYRYHQYNNEPTSIFASVWASYIFVFIAVLITFTIVFAVGYLINSMTYNATRQIASEKIISSNVFDDRRSSMVIQRVRDIIRKSNSTKEKTNETKLGKPYNAKLFPVPMYRKRKRR
uniref:Uncharacterized protein n=1 Tax=Acrobeloides nanus TaxID=290746 RepID=A0A914CXX6_9BILA